MLKLGQVPSGPPYKLIDLHVDHLGSTRVTTDESGAVLAQHDFFPFGEEIVPMADDSTKMFTGHERDQDTGLDYMIARYYSSVFSRFLSVDPSRASVKSRAPKTWNRYSYALNAPVTFLDPDGKVTVGFTGFGNNPGGVTKAVGKLDGATGLGAAKTFRHQDVSKAVEFAKAEHAKNPDQAVIVVGHSLGADSALAFSKELAKSNIKVDLQVTIDLVGGEDRQVSTNVSTAINYKKEGESGLGGDVDVAGDPSTTAVANIEVKGTEHTTVDEAVAPEVVKTAKGVGETAAAQAPKKPE